MFKLGNAMLKGGIKGAEKAGAEAAARAAPATRMPNNLLDMWIKPAGNHREGMRYK